MVEGSAATISSASSIGVIGSSAPARTSVGHWTCASVGRKFIVLNSLLKLKNKSSRLVQQRGYILGSCGVRLYRGKQIRTYSSRVSGVGVSKKFRAASRAVLPPKRS